MAMAMVVINPAPELEPAMKNLVLALLLAFAVLGGAVAVSTVTANSAYADGSGNGGGH